MELQSKVSSSVKNIRNKFLGSIVRMLPKNSILRSFINDYESYIHTLTYYSGGLLCSIIMTILTWTVIPEFAHLNLSLIFMATGGYCLGKSHRYFSYLKDEYKIYKTKILQRRRKLYLEYIKFQKK